MGTRPAWTNLPGMESAVVPGVIRQKGDAVHGRKSWRAHFYAELAFPARRSKGSRPSRAGKKSATVSRHSRHGEEFQRFRLRPFHNSPHYLGRAALGLVGRHALGLQKSFGRDQGIA